MTKVSSNRLNTISAPANMIFNVFYILYSVVCIYPILLMVGVSFTDDAALSNSGYRVIPAVFSTYGYEFIFKAGGTIFRAYLNTIIATAVGTFFSVLFVSMFAYAISRRELRYKKFLTYFLIFTMVFNGGMVS